MKKNTKPKNNFFDFRFKREFIIKLSVVTASIICGIALLILCIICAGNTKAWNSCFIAVLALGAVFIILSVISFITLLKLFYNIVFQTDIKFQQMEKRNDTLQKLDKKRSFEKVLNDYLDYFTTSSEGEYSARLLQKQAELDYMQSQINPHFLYNTLDSIRGQAVNDNSEKTANMIQSLSRIFRYTISRHDDIVPLKSELENVGNYMRLQQYRFLNRFDWKITYEDKNSESDILSYRIPKLTLQPIVENAVKHGMDSIFEHGFIEIRIITTQSRLIITVSDNGPGIDIKALVKLNESFEKNSYAAKRLAMPEKAGGMGLLNVNARLKLLYGDAYGLTAFSAVGSGAKIQIVLPLKKEIQNTENEK